MKNKILITLLWLSTCAYADIFPVTPPAPPAMYFSIFSLFAQPTIIVPKPQPKFTNILIGITASSNSLPIDGVVIFYGNKSMNYKTLLFFPYTNTFTISNLDIQKPYFFNAVFFTSNSTPYTNCSDSKSGKSTCYTNLITTSDYGGEFVYITSNTLPFLIISNQTAVLTGYGISNMNYVVYGGSSADQCNQKVYSFSGTNGIWTYREALSPLRRFFKTTFQTKFQTNQTNF